MFNKITIAFLLLNGLLVAAQKRSEQMPIFPNCEKLQAKELENCFNTEVQNFVYNNFQVPTKLKDSNYKGSIIVLF